jgi:hypothetical protein
MFYPWKDIRMTASQMVKEEKAKESMWRRSGTAVLSVFLKSMI